MPASWIYKQALLKSTAVYALRSSVSNVCCTYSHFQLDRSTMAFVQTNINETICVPSQLDSSVLFSCARGVHQRENSLLIVL